MDLICLAQDNVSWQRIVNTLVNLNAFIWSANLAVNTEGTQIPRAKSPGRLNFVRWPVIFVGSQYGTCSMSSFWNLEFWGVAWIFGESVDPS